ncbi:hypothetical protein BDC45DRAFT_512735 [Circinella umbellata]|nr:hypothetical protein BDC45DRAFT_512735 [Circinella umbellata]
MHNSMESDLPTSKLLYPFDEHAQLRQLRSKFDRLSTYLCYRFSSKSTIDVRSRPYTIWTIADRSRNDDRDSSVVASSRLFKHIAAQVWAKGTAATLKLDFVKSLKSMCKERGTNEKIFDSIEALYEDDTSIITKGFWTAVGACPWKLLEFLWRRKHHNQHWQGLLQGLRDTEFNISSSIDNSTKIIGNRELNRSLKNLASLLSSVISQANDQISDNIHHVMNEI